MRSRLAVVLGLILCLTTAVVQASTTPSGDVSLTTEASDGRVTVNVESDGEVENVTIVATREDPVEGSVVDGVAQANVSAETDATVTLDGLRANASLNVTALDGSTPLPSVNAHAAIVNATGVDGLDQLDREPARTPGANETSQRTLAPSLIAREKVVSARALVTDSGLVVVGYLSYGGTETHRTSDGPVQARISTDAGRTFGPEIQITSETTPTTGNFNLVELAPDRVLFLVDVERDDTLFQGAVLDARTGDVLDRPVYRPAGPDADYGFALAPGLAPVAPGAVLLASADIEWTGGDGSTHPPTDAVTIWQLDGEGTMRPVQTLAGHGDDPRGAQIAVSPTGEAALVYTTFDDGGDDDRDGWSTAYVSRAAHTGASFSTPEPVDALDEALPNESDGAEGPEAVAISSTGTAHATFSNHPTGQNKVDAYHVRLPAGNRTPIVHHIEEGAPPLSEGDDTFGFHPTVATRGDRVWLLYDNARNAVALESTDGGRTFGPQYLLEPEHEDAQYKLLDAEGALTVLPDGRPLATVHHHPPAGGTNLSAITPFDPLHAGGLETLSLDRPDPQPYAWHLGDPPQADWIGEASSGGDATGENDTGESSTPSNDTENTTGSNETTEATQETNDTSANTTTPNATSPGNTTSRNTSVNDSANGSMASDAGPGAEQVEGNGSTPGNDTRTDTPAVGLALLVVLGSLAALVPRRQPD